MEFFDSNIEVKIKPIAGDVAFGSIDHAFDDSAMVFEKVSRCVTDKGEATLALIFRFDYKTICWTYMFGDYPPPERRFDVINYLKEMPFIAAPPIFGGFLSEVEFYKRYSDYDLRGDFNWFLIENKDVEPLKIRWPAWSSKCGLGWVLGSPKWQINNYRKRYHDEFLGISKDQLRLRYERCSEEEKKWYLFEGIFQK